VRLHFVTCTLNLHLMIFPLNLFVRGRISGRFYVIFGICIHLRTDDYLYILCALISVNSQSVKHTSRLGVCSKDANEKNIISTLIL